MIAPLDLVASPDIFKITHDLADVWISKDGQTEVDYFYGGTRLVAPAMTDIEVKKNIRRLTLYESSFKNRLIDLSLAGNVLSKYSDRLPKGFMESRVGGARCIIRPRTEEIYAVLKNPQHVAFHTTISRLFEHIGEFLNEARGKIKLTPDFGRYAGLADTLEPFTPHVLGIRCDAGGCGGKSSYSSTGIIAALETLGYGERKDIPVTLIGSAGAMGSDVLKYFWQGGFSDFATCDLAYDNNKLNTHCSDMPIQLPSKKQAFTDACLQRGGLIAATTLGQELENSNWQVMPANTTFLLAHNLAIPEGEAGITLMRNIAARGILAFPGQILTLGGALTSRLEWFWRQTRAHEFFDKPLAHTIVRAVVSSLIASTYSRVEDAGLSPYEVLLEYCRMG